MFLATVPAAPEDGTAAPAAGDTTDAAGSADSAVHVDAFSTIINILQGGASDTAGTPAAPVLRINEVPEVAVVPEVTHEVKKIVVSESTHGAFLLLF